MKTVFVLANHWLTEMFDLLAPFYIFDELHVIKPETFTKSDLFFFKKVKTIISDNQQNKYLCDVYLNRIGKQYGSQFEQFIKVSLDYN